MNYEDICFTTEKDFKDWKEATEKESGAFYVRDSGRKLRKSDNEAISEYFSCHRSYSSRVKTSERKRLVRSIGSNKFGFCCPSSMVITRSSDNHFIKVKFCSTHVGHDHNIRQVPLSKNVKQEIAGKLVQGVTVQHIIDDIRDNCEDCINRKHFITKRDIWNIKKEFRIRYSTKMHENDAISTSLWVEKMKKLNNENNPVLFFKQLGEKYSFTGESCIYLNEKDVCLLIMTPFQKQMLQTFGNEKICIDGTHGINAYGFILYILVVVDKYGNGIPAAFFFTNRSDTSIYSLYFSHIKQAVGVLKLKVFMSDDEPAFYNAWQAVMGSADHQLLCSWYILRNWQQNLGKIKNNDKKKIVFKSLKILMKISDSEIFKNGLNKTINDLVTDPDTSEFGKYFISHYAHRYEKWAYCCRLRLGINTNMYNETHNFE